MPAKPTQAFGRMAKAGAKTTGAQEDGHLADGVQEIGISRQVFTCLFLLISPGTH